MERIKVLYVDDEEGNLMAFQASFRRDFDIHVALSGSEALAWLEQNTVHVVISDQRMPGMTGSEFLAIVKTRWPRCVRLLLTGFSDIQAVVDAINLGGIHAYITKPWDPTDLKLRIEQAHEVHALREERERLFDRYRQVFDASGDPIVIVDGKGCFREMNAAAEQLMKVDRATMLNSGLGKFVTDLPEMVRRMRHNRHGRTYRNVDVTLQTPGGHTIDCLVTATHVGRTPEGVSMYQAMIKDITDRKQQEAYLKKLNSDLDKRVAVRTKQLLEALDDLGAFSYSVAHDLRSPLKNIKVLSDHLSGLAAVRGDEEERDLSHRIHKGASRLINLVDDLLRFARTDSQKVECRDADVNEIMHECLSDLTLPQEHVEFVLPEPGTAIIHADPAMVKVALNNLLANAVKFTRNTAQARIEVGHSTKDGDDILWVKDNGVGFESQKKDQLFGVFKRLHTTAQFEGTGIGLALVDRIMKKHGGSCSAEGAPNEGATIFLRFPGQRQADEMQYRQAG
ncbi:MAG: response regulator [Flavobacteriales bacterium]|nr:response regulator [Flavobacteriales bacterium]MBK6893933.1 response regulator [Flavobacteriales bacterium]MBK7247877.1 response regulator [Flavobacteriales bacterium]MBK9598941.1 response regulator [Flavobacteriales bacterium]QQS73146.1 MAG: response regulator [Flavobacteriales bacterium]